MTHSRETDRWTARRRGKLTVWAFACLVGCGGSTHGATSSHATTSSAGGSTSTSLSSAATTGGGGSGPRLQLEPCYDTLECGTVDVPIDYGNPAAGTIGIRVARATAMKPSERIGVILLNPGGPGGQMVAGMKQMQAFFQTQLPDVAERFDLVGFDWRGVGQSAPIDCVDDSFLDDARGHDVSPSDAGGVAELDQLAGTFASGCVSRTGQTMLENLYTENAARDMDRIRDALGEAKLNYLGISYGTFLGATYMTMFPGRVRAFVLDSATGVTPSRFTGMQSQADGYETALQRFFTACASDATCAFHGGVDVATLEAKWDALEASIRTTPVNGGSRLAHEIDFYLMALNTLRNADWKGLATALADLEAGDATSLLSKADAEIGRMPNGSYIQFFEPLVAIGCIDRGFSPGTTMSDVEAFADTLATSHPRMGRAMTMPWFMCARWPYAHAAAPIAAKGAPPALVVGGAHDPATPYTEALALRDALGNGSELLTYEGEGHGHLLHSACVDATESAFLVDPSAPLMTMDCPAP